MSKRHANWCLDSCESVTHAKPHLLLPRGGPWAPIVRMRLVRGKEMDAERQRGNISR